MFDRLKRFWLMQSVRPRARVVGHVDVSQWRRQTLEDEEFEGVEFAGDAWDQWMAIGCRFVDCTFGGLRVRNGEPAFGGGSRQSQYVRCNFDGANLRHFAPGLARFEQCSFHRVIISDCHSFNAEFVECAFSGRIRDTVFWGHDWAFQVSRQNEFVRNDFSQCVLDGVSFRGGISVREQRLPEADKYLYVADLAAALNHIRRRRPDPNHPLLHKVITTILSSDLETGQSDALYEPRRFGENAHESAVATRWLREACGMLSHREND